MYMHCTLNWIKSVPTNSNLTLPAFLMILASPPRPPRTLPTAIPSVQVGGCLAGSKGWQELELGSGITKGAWVSSRCLIFWVKRGCCDFDIHEFSQIIIRNEGLSILQRCMTRGAVTPFCEAVPVSALPPSALPSALPSGGAAVETGYSGPWFHLTVWW